MTEWQTDGQNDKKFSTWNPEAKCMVCTWLKNIFHQLSKRVYKSSMDFSNLRIWTNQLEASNSRPCSRGQCTSVLVRREQILSLAWQGKIDNAFSTPSHESWINTNLFLEGRKFVWNFTVFLHYELKIICRSKDILVRKVGHLQNFGGH